MGKKARLSWFQDTGTCNGLLHKSLCFVQSPFLVMTLKFNIDFKVTLSLWKAQRTSLEGRWFHCQWCKSVEETNTLESRVFESATGIAL